jgi:hypothetical protein
MKHGLKHSSKAASKLDCDEDKERIEGKLRRGIARMRLGQRPHPKGRPTRAIDMLLMTSW